MREEESERVRDRISSPSILICTIFPFSLSIFIYLFFFLSHSYSLSISLSFYLPFIHSLTHSLNLPHSLFPSHFFAPSLSLSYYFSLSDSQSLSLSFSLTLFFTFSLLFSITLSLSLFIYLFPIYCSLLLSAQKYNSSKYSFGMINSKCRFFIINYPLELNFHVLSFTLINVLLYSI